MLNEKWTKWVIASVNKYFSDALTTFTLISKVDGQETDFTGDKWVEIRIQGPTFTKQSLHVYKIDTIITIIHTMKRAKVGSSNAYQRWVDCGNIQKLMDTNIQINQLGIGDSGAALVCIAPQSKIDLINWGEMTLDSQTPIRAYQTTIEAPYSGVLKG